MGTVSRHKTRKLFLFGLMLVFLFIAFIFFVNSYNSEGQIANRFQNNFLKQELVLVDKIPAVIEILDGEEKKFWPRFERLLNEHQIYAQIYRNDTLLFWNNSLISNKEIHPEIEAESFISHLQTGWYLTQYQKYNNYTIFLFKEIKSEYSVSNSYLPVEIQSTFSSYENIRLTLDTLSTKRIIRNRNNNAVLGIIIQRPIALSNSSIILLFSLYILIYLVFLSWISRLYMHLNVHYNKTYLLYLFFVLDVIILRSLDYYFDFPAILKTSFLFETNPLGFPGFSSIGDLIMNVILILYVTVRMFRMRGNKSNTVEKQQTAKRSLLVLVFLWVVSISVFYFIFYIVSQLPYTSHFGTLFNNIGGIGYLFSIVILLIALLLTIVSLSQYFVVTKNILFGYILFTLLLSALALLSFYNESFLLIIPTVFLLLIVLLLFFNRDRRGISTEKYLLILVIISAAAALIINRADSKTRDTHQLQAIAYLAHTHETELELAYTKIYKKIRKDTVVQNIVASSAFNKEDELAWYLQEKYFSDFWKKYDIQLTICAKEEQLEIQPENILINCNDYFLGLINDFGEETDDPTLFLLNADPESIYYLGDLEFENIDDSLEIQHVYIEFFYTIVPKGLGYPELLVDQKFSNVDLTAYSFARYENDKLVYKFGNFAYHTNFQFLKTFPTKTLFNFLKFRHYQLETNPGNYLVVSRPNTLLTEKISTFSILFIILGFTFFATVLFLFGRKSESVFRPFVFGINFQTRLQIIFTGSIAFIIILIAVITMYYVRSNNEENLTDQLNEKTYSVLIELQHKLGGEENLEDYDEEMLFQLLRKFSMVFFSDINLYNSSGQLIATSRPEIFDKGLLSENINPMAFEELFVDNKLFYLTEEKIGTLAYYSSYVPLILDGNKPIGIINLPYFARQNEVRHAYNQMLFTFVNLFVLLGIFGIFIALILSKVLTKPLKVLQQSLANIRIDKQNEKIRWNKKDEIGKLIEEYNRMVDKLEQSAELLKHSERESTWREVARQIAHEIKNPLTPMKLNVQYLEKAYRESDPDFDNKIRSISVSLIEQIESLNRVAEMFADFSKSTTKNLEEVNLLSTINSSVELFKNNRDVKISVTNYDNDLSPLVSANSSDVLRVFNNLIKNSIQSLVGVAGGHIDISIETKAPWYIVRISDNGKGIDDETKHRIFQPYFTTKSTGTGLGLAIVKSIMTGIGGEIEFESRTGKGSVFTLKFKAIN